MTGQLIGIWLTWNSRIPRNLISQKTKTKTRPGPGGILRPPRLMHVLAFCSSFAANWMRSISRGLSLYINIFKNSAQKSPRVKVHGPSACPFPPASASAPARAFLIFLFFPPATQLSGSVFPASYPWGSEFVFPAICGMHYRRLAVARDRERDWKRTLK